MNTAFFPHPTHPVSRDISAIGRIGAVPAILKAACRATGMRFAAIARMTDTSWTACAVRDNVGYGIEVGRQLDIESTLCNESRDSQLPVVFDQASEHPRYQENPAQRMFNVESCISVPIVRGDGRRFGSLCAADPLPRQVANARTLETFQVFAELIASHLDSQDREAAYRRELADLRSQSERREQFIAITGHDLRNPLWAVLAGGESLARGLSAADAPKLGRRIAKAAQRMAGMVEDMVDFGRGRLGNGMSLDLAPVPQIGNLFHDIVEELRDAHPGRIIQETIAVPGIVHCDSRRMQRLLSNLLGNALVHGDPRAPVSVAAWADRNWLRLRIHNEGTPIPADDQERLFEPYWRSPESASTGGLGLGLYICRQIVRAHEGTLEFASTLEGGTWFEVRIPVRG